MPPRALREPYSRAKALFRWIQANHNYFTIFHGLDGNDIALVDSRLLPSFGRDHPLASSINRRMNKANVE